MNLFQIISLFFLTTMTVGQIRTLRGLPTIKMIYGLRWVFVTLLAMIVIWDPNISAWIADFLGISRGTDVIVYSTIILLFYQNFQLSKEVETLQSKLDKLVRKIGLKQTTW